MAVFFNQASLSYGGNITNSNVVSGEIITGVSITKTAGTTDYGANETITYVVSIVNAESTPYTNLTLTDNLGLYTLPGGTELVPLDYVANSVIYYQNGVLQSAPAVTAGPPLTITGITVPAGGNVIIIYEGRANEFAPLNANGSITNIATIDACEEAEATVTVPVRNESNLNVAKSVCPPVVTCSGEVNYTFVIQNTGNTAVVATDDLVLSDTFNPILKNITVTLDGVDLVEGVDYTYNEVTGEFATVASRITVPAATYTTDPVTGVITSTPGVATLTVTGTL